MLAGRWTEMARQAWVWQGVEHWTLPDLLETLQLISDEDETEDFMESYTEVCGSEEYAWAMLGYMAELISHQDKDEGERICELFQVERQEVFPQPGHTFGRMSFGINPEKPSEPDFEHESEEELTAA